MSLLRSVSMFNFFSIKEQIYWFRLLFFLVICFFLLHFTLNKSQLIQFGDGAEYVLMSQALYNHGTPDIRPKDILSYKNQVEQGFEWEQQREHEAYDALYSFADNLEAKNMMNRVQGYAVAKNKRMYSIHFFGYPLMTLPLKMVLRPFQIHPVKELLLTNVLMVLFVIYLLLFYFPLNFFEGIFSSLIFLTSTVIYYLFWVHPEVFVSTLLFTGFLFYYFKKPFLGVFICSLAAMQYQPAALFVMVLILGKLLEDRFKFFTLVKLFCCSFLILLPPVFYYLNFGVTNLVKHFGFLDTKYITATRVIGFFTDLNQGVILNYPLLLLMYLMLLYLRSKKVIKTGLSTLKGYDFIPLVMVAVVMIVSTMGNWSHGQSTTNRYVLVIGTMLVFHFLLLTKELKDVKWVVSSAILVLVVQFLTVKYFGGSSTLGFDGDRHKVTARVVLDHFPSLYNPDPHIFYQRTNPYQPNEVYHKGVLYLNEQGEFKKGIINVHHLDEVELPFLSKVDLENLIEGKNQQYGWVYFHQQDLQALLTAEQLQLFSQQAKAKHPYLK